MRIQLTRSRYVLRIKSLQVFLVRTYSCLNLLAPYIDSAITNRIPISPTLPTIDGPVRRVRSSPCLMSNENEAFEAGWNCGSDDSLEPASLVRKSWYGEWALQRVLEVQGRRERRL